MRIAGAVDGGWVPIDLGHLARAIAALRSSTEGEVSADQAPPGAASAPTSADAGRA